MNKAQPTTVLLIEDDPAFAEVLRVVFSRHHCRVVTAPTMQQALTALTAPEAPQLVVVDLALPDSDPQETIARITDLRGRTGESIVLVLSGALPPGARIPPGVPYLSKHDNRWLDKLRAVVGSFRSGLTSTSSRLAEIDRLLA